jgi:hypothetical protein
MADINVAPFATQTNAAPLKTWRPTEFATKPGAAWKYVVLPITRIDAYGNVGSGPLHDAGSEAPVLGQAGRTAVNALKR